MAFVSTFTGLLAALVVWVALYTFAADSGNPLLASLATHLEAFSVGGWLLFATLAVAFAALTYRAVRPKRNGT